jgi:hypothetical protein
MSYAQKNYNSQLGNGHYTIATAGCFVTAFSNLLERYGAGLDPSNLNNFLLSHSLYLRDSDGSLEDLSFGSISGYNGAIHVVKTGSGWPSGDNSIVKFIYRDTKGNNINHFCLMHNAAQQLIIDSYDGVVKKSPYGTPVAYATYENTNPQPVHQFNPPAQPTDTSYHAWSGKVTASRVSQVRANATHLAVGNLGNVNKDGLLYAGNVFDVIGWQKADDPYNDGRDIWLKTARNHWVWAYNTNFFTLPGHGAGEPEAPSVPVKVNDVVYTRLKEPINLVTIPEPTNVWNFIGAPQIVKTVTSGTAFTAVGKAIKENDPTNTTYFMDEESFGQVDTSGLVGNPLGINTVDLIAPPEKTYNEPAADQPTLQSENEGKVEVKVLPPDPHKFKQTYQGFLGPVDYRALGSMVIRDAEGIEPDVELSDNQIVRVGGQFEKDGIKYFRTQHSVTNNVWYGIPVDLLEKVGTDSEKDVDALSAAVLGDAKREAEHAAIKKKAGDQIAIIEGWPARLINLLRHKRGSVK